MLYISILIYMDVKAEKVLLNINKGNDVRLLFFK